MLQQLKAYTAKPYNGSKFRILISKLLETFKNCNFRQKFREKSCPLGRPNIGSFFEFEANEKLPMFRRRLYNLVQDPKYAHLWVIGCREPPRMDHTVWWQLKEILNRFQVTWRFFYSREKWICNVLNSTGENFKYLKGEKIVMVYKIVVEDKIVMDDKIVMVYHLHYSGVMVGSNKKFDDSSNWISSDRFHEISIKNLLSEKKEFESQKHRKNLTELACKTSILFDTVLLD